MTDSVYMYAPPGMTIPADSLLRLNKSLYGCHQAGRNWVQYHRDHLIDAGYTSMLREECIFIRRSPPHWLVSEVHTDNADIITNDDDMAAHYLGALATFCTERTIRRRLAAKKEPGAVGLWQP